MRIIAKIHSDYKEKFGIPRQSGIAKGLTSVIVFEPEYRREEALRGIEGFSHLWLIWEFSEAKCEGWSPTVRPPRLGGNRRMGVFATRSPFRPNPIGLSSVRLCEVRKTEKDGTVLVVADADLLDGTPIYDIKPYLAFSDAHPDAVCGFSEEVSADTLSVDFPEELLGKIEPEKRGALLAILAGDPRPHYQDDPEREYGFRFACYEIRFTVKNGTLTVRSVGYT